MGLRLALLLVAVASFPATTTAATAEEFAERVAEAAHAEAKRAVEAPDRFEVVASRFTGSDVVPAGHYVLVPSEIDGPNSSGIVRIGFRVEVDGKPGGYARASVRGRRLGPALVAREVLRYGETIAPGKVEIVETDLTRLRGLLLRSHAELQGRAAGRTVSVGRVLTDEILRPPTVVRRGETVAMAVNRSGLRVTLRADALKDGASGDRIPVRNLATGARMVGEVQADGTLILIEHARSSR